MLFGVHYKMRRHLSGSFQDVYVFSTLMASFCATLATLPLDKLRKEYHIEYLKREGMRHHYDQPEQTLPTQ